jgi:hypothetical protein
MLGAVRWADVFTYSSEVSGLDVSSRWSAAV